MLRRRRPKDPHSQPPTTSNNNNNITLPPPTTRKTKIKITMQPPDQPAEMQPLMLLDSDEDDDISDTEAAAPRSTQPLPPPQSGTTTSSHSWRQRNQWVVLALVSGACAAFNGVFAKLTTTELTSRLALGLAHVIGLAKAAAAVEIAVRAIFFGLNLAFNGLREGAARAAWAGLTNGLAGLVSWLDTNMWTVFTKALARGHSATQVSVMNTSANFVITALLGSAIFSEALPPLWWLGAAMLVAGNVIIGRKDETGSDSASQTAADEELLATDPGPSPTAATRHNGSGSGSGFAPSSRSTTVLGENRTGNRGHDDDVLDLDVSDI